MEWSSEFCLIQKVVQRRQEVAGRRVRAAPAHHVGQTATLPFLWRAPEEGR